MKIKKGEHVFIAGRTGSGKTFLTKRYLQNVHPVYALDVKKTLDWQNVPEDDIDYLDRLEKVTKSRKKKVIYQPHWDEMKPEFYNEFFKFIYKKEETTIWVDETMGIGTAMKFPEYYKALLTRGRELGISVWSCTQRPATIPIISMSEATHLFIFDLNMKKDRVRIAEIAGEEEFLKLPGKYVFWYYNMVDSSKPIRAKLVEKGGNEGGQIPGRGAG